MTSLLGAPKVKTIRGFSDFGFSYVYVIFEDGTDIYWARIARPGEACRRSSRALPEGVKTELGPDATSVGWIYQYALVDESGKNSTDELRSYQDWYLALLAPGRAGGRRGRVDRRVREAVPGEGRSPRPPGL